MPHPRAHAAHRTTAAAKVLALRDGYSERNAAAKVLALRGGYLRKTVAAKVLTLRGRYLRKAAAAKVLALPAEGYIPSLEKVTYPPKHGM